MGASEIELQPVGTGVMINAFKQGQLDAQGLEPALIQMERLNAEAARIGGETLAAGLGGIAVQHRCSLPPGIKATRVEVLLVAGWTKNSPERVRGLVPDTGFS